MTDSSSTVDNGVHVQALLDARDALTKAPQAAQFKWRAACEWKNGTHSHSTVEWLCVPFFHSHAARHLNCAATGALVSASRASSKA